MTRPPVFTDDVGPDRAVPWHFGDPLKEQRQLIAGVARVDQSHRGVVTVTGPDRLGWLHDLTTAHVAQLRSGGSAMPLILDPQGRIEFILRMVDDGEQTWLTTEPGRVEALVAYLESMRFLKRVAVADASRAFAAVWETTPVEQSRATAVWQQPAEFTGTGVTPSGSDRGGDAGRYVPTRPAVLPGHEVLLPRELLPGYLDDAEPAGSWALSALRVAAAIPREGFETDNRTIPHEIGLIGPAVHLAKGCYRGQETVARVHNLGRPPRRLALAHLDGSEERLPAHGDEVVVADRVVGWAGTAAQHHELGPIATVILKRSVPMAADLLVAGIPATQEPVVIAEAGAPRAGASLS